jgi:hypothetical protein
MQATMTSGFSFDLGKMVRVLILTAMLTVGALNVTKCSNGDDDIESAARDQYDRMHKIVVAVGGN